MNAIEFNYRVGASVHRQIAAVLEDFAAEFARVVAARLFLVVHRTDAADAADAAAHRRVAQTQRRSSAAGRTHWTTDAVAAVFIRRTQIQ